ncbi:MAG: leucine--tRNA ligase [Candidatus Nealsonbacteria bacterium DGGOD1a]|nr:MAG: leucine--tRNA ligase [Candidatus Nealsonbacteria bacterium DGGOD1a]
MEKENCDKNEEYRPSVIEPKWQKFWEETKSHRAADDSEKPKFYNLDMFPYPSGAGLHVGHFKGYAANDVVARQKRMAGFDVLHPMGWDAFGLPAENYAIKTGIQPEISTNKNIENIKRQMKMAGLSYDWSREINTTDPEYYKWTQWIFLKLFERGLAYESELPINWCPKCLTGLANEEVVGGNCERCGAPVGKKNLRQWVLKITAYADRLLEDLAGLDWPDRIVEMQRNWIGKSEGAEVKFKIKGLEEEINVFTTRPDTLFGCTYIVLAPEHPLVEKLKDKIANRAAVESYVKAAKQKMDLERISDVKDKTGVRFEGITAINPVNGREISVWAADYVLMNYGTGAVMAVPSHDCRDFDFAKKYNLEIIEVIRPESGPAELPYEGGGALVNSGQFDGLDWEEAKSKIIEWLKGRGSARKTVHYKLRDWVFSRQRYWGEPIPLIHCDKCGTVPVPEDQLPLRLPQVEKYQPTGTGESPLAAIADWVNTVCPKCGGAAKRETNTMPQWAGSSWYYLRFLDPANGKELVSKNKEKYWMPVDLYVGGAEHAVLHLLYARFWHKVLFDIGAVSTKEPFQKLRNIGIVLAEDGQKMSKSKGNVVSPDDIVKEFGADTLRVYELFMGPFDQAIAWSTDSVRGSRKFLGRVWHLVLECADNKKSGDEILRKVHKLNQKISGDIEQLKFNTAIAAFMEFLNFAESEKKNVGKDALKRLILLLAPFAPHICEELWRNLGNPESVFAQPWPMADQNLLKEDTIEIIVQINGKMRDKISISADAGEQEAIAIAKDTETIKKWLDRSQIKKTIFVSGRLINFVV